MYSHVLVLPWKGWKTKTGSTHINRHYSKTMCEKTSLNVSLIEIILQELVFFALDMNLSLVVSCARDMMLLYYSRFITQYQP